MIFLPNSTGYDLFTSKIHQDPITGIIHGICMPFACRGFFMIVFGLVSCFENPKRLTLNPRNVTKNLLWFIVGGMLSGYITFDPVWGVLSLLLYSSFLTHSINRFDTIKQPIIMGIINMILCIFVMEFISHWYIEAQASNLWELPNSIYHTVLYSTKSLLDH